ncbi:TPA: aspartate carbamoyltransferase [Candidatus Acetothermia bacterium]|mgnify:CR=1 FL=1|nr:aspartate carbamoyltransferase [Candidatus Acetothermia bacterium]
MATLRNQDILRADQFSKEEVVLIMDTARAFEQDLQAGKVLDTMSGQVLATLFFEPSTRTRLSFESAMLRLGGGVVTVANPKTSSAAKGESLHDTIRTVEGYADLIVLRHPQIGAAEQAAAATDKPVLNAGDGAGQHPTQSLLDLYTIEKEKKTADGLTISLAGDLKNGRTVHSLVDLLTLFDVKFYFVAPPALRMPQAIVAKLKNKGIKVTEAESLEEALAASDVLYMTRIQRERFKDPSEYDRLKDTYVLTKAMLAGAKEGMTVMHPLPRVNEIATEVDSYAGAAYFRQAANGIPIRMALLALVTGRA